MWCLKAYIGQRGACAAWQSQRESGAPQWGLDEPNESLGYASIAPGVQFAARVSQEMADTTVLIW